MEIEFYEIIIFMLVYGGLFLYTLRTISLRNKGLAYIKSALLILFYLFMTTVIWSTYQSEQDHVNDHSGLDSINIMGEATFVIVGLSIYSIFLLVIGIYLKRKKQ
ncbi:peptide ABC transporter permease [Ornithinibacillus halotolerans]|uniref:Uncharacterized protein n=1 Tax=Ornithinibacillus halotolerans TaxID=1274357 RepID=A0A916RKP5_9BACI|nr:peptide ABC transporter permease [Ornithinibacillus halotolerans]GGA60008.1 hypothetical protein GCM10008025_00040 [Ornithinibacillus halotolerans]